MSLSASLTRNNIDQSKIEKLLCRVESLIRALEETKSIEVHQRVNQFYYMEKSEELKFLLGYVKETQEKLQTLNIRIEDCRVEVFHRWREDARWLQGSGD
jgi:hypothetical protein